MKEIDERLITTTIDVLEELIAIAEQAMKEANRDGAGWEIEDAIKPAKECVKYLKNI